MFSDVMQNCVVKVLDEFGIEFIVGVPWSTCQLNSGFEM